MNQKCYQEIITEDLTGLRLDRALAKLLPQFSRSQLQIWIKQGCISVDQKVLFKNREKVFTGQVVAVSVVLVNQDDWQPQAIPLDIIYQDDAFLVVNKQAGLVVHPGAGNPESTLVNALLHHDSELKKVPRAGLIHRLDKNTSGLLVVARTLEAHHFLTSEMQARKIHRIYDAIVIGHPRPSGTINLPIGRHPTQRTKMAVLTHSGRVAKTHYQVVEKFPVHSRLIVELETGRTHQIRVHLAYINHPILGDPLYGRNSLNRNLTPEAQAAVSQFQRQALHATKIILTHPITHQDQTFEAPPPKDFINLLEKLRKNENSEAGEQNNEDVY